MLVVYIACLLPLIGLYYFYTARFGIKHGKMSRATILSLEKDLVVVHRCHISLQFTTKDGQEVNATLMEDFPHRIPKVGGTLSILYLKEDPQQVILYSRKTSKILLFGCMVFTLIFLVAEWWRE
jgi:hypothetical protein